MSQPLPSATFEVDDADADCLWYLPGSHRLDVLAHRHPNDDPAAS